MYIYISTFAGMRRAAFR